jgi:thymidylate synthase
MINRIEGASISDVYPRLLSRLYGYGATVAPRGLPVRELLNVNLQISDARRNVLVNKVRSPNYRFMVAEWLWMLFGHSDVETLTRFNSKMIHFSDDGVVLAGAYGPPIREQLPYVVDTLTADRDSRQAVLTIWKPKPAPSRDVPCTVSAQFLIREGNLHGIFTMRSSDAWLGIPYDVFCFGQWINYLAYLLNAGIGSLSLNLGSSHLYERDTEGANEARFDEPKMIPPRSDVIQSPFPWELEDVLTGKSRVIGGWLHPWTRFASVLNCRTSDEARKVLEL